MFNIGLGFGVLTFCCGYYLGERGLTGVKNDLNNVKNDISNIKGKIDGSTTTTVVAPVAPVVRVDPVTPPAG